MKIRKPGETLKRTNVEFLSTTYSFFIELAEARDVSISLLFDDVAHFVRKHRSQFDYVRSVAPNPKRPHPSRR